MVACSIVVVAVIFLICANIDRVFAILTIISLTLTGALVDDLAAVTDPFAHMFMTSGIVHAGIADTLIHVDIAVAAECRIIGVVITLKHSTLRFILKHKGNSAGIDALRTVFASSDSVTTVLAHAVCKAIHTCALVRMERHTQLHTRLSAGGAVLTRAAVALVHIEIAVARKTR
jgi:hypothetical protein